jgi:hypothetical protein
MTMNMNTDTGNTTARCRLLGFFLLPAFLLLVQPALAQDERAEREIQAAKEKVHRLMQESEELRHQAEQLAARIEAYHARKEEDRRGDRVREADRELVEILEGLEHGMVALERIGKRDLHDMLGEIADAVRAKRRALHGERDVIGIGTAPGRSKEGDRAQSEREAALHQLEVMRIAMHALLEAERGDAAELLERAIHSREVNLEGRRDEEARAIRERAPGLGEQTEILLHAADLWDEFGHEKKAALVRELGRQFQAKFRRSRAAEQERAAAQQGRAAEEQREEARAQRERARNERERARAERERAAVRERRADGAMRIERLEDRLERLEGMLEEMHAVLEELRRKDR